MPILIILLLVLVGLAFVVVLWIAGAYNGLVRLRNQLENAWAQIDVQLKRRHDLIPNLVETVKGYAEARERDPRSRHPGAQHGRQRQNRRRARRGRERPDRRIEIIVRRRRGLSRPQSQPEFPGPPGRTDIHGEQDLLFPPVLQ